MSMSTHVVGIRPPDAKWKKMKAVWDACKLADISTPDEVYEFFAGEEPDDAGVVVEIEKSIAVTAWGDDGRAGFEVNIGRLPQDVTVIRFYNSR